MKLLKFQSVFIAAACTALLGLAISSLRAVPVTASTASRSSLCAMAAGYTVGIYKTESVVKQTHGEAQGGGQPSSREESIRTCVCSWT